jgi:acetolactate synthase small subunit
MTMQRLLQIRTQAKLGALDRVLGALTHRGIIPQAFTCTQVSDKVLDIQTSFTCADDHVMHKLCKFLDRQVYILSVEDISASPVCVPLGLSIPPFPHAVENIEVEASLASA